MTLEPTPKLRLLERPTGSTVVYGIPTEDQFVRVPGPPMVRVLQQWWRDVETGEGVWRDVPLEEE